MSGKKALLVIDMQNDYLSEDRKSMFTYDTEKLVASVNNAITLYNEKGYDIIYIIQVFQDIITNRWFIGFTIKGTLGAELYEEIDVVSDNIFEKYFSDAFTSKPFLVHVKKKGYSEVVLCGLDEYGCVGATAKGAVRFGMTTYILKDSVGSRFSKRKIEKIRLNLKKIGV